MDELLLRKREPVHPAVARFVVSVCDDPDKNCPNFKGKVGRRVHIGFPDPARAIGADEQKMAVFCQVREDIRVHFRKFYEQELQKPTR